MNKTMQHTFYRGSGGSFLVTEEEKLAVGYERKMLENARLPDLLEENAVCLDGRYELHYRISGMQTMEKKFAKQKMKTADVTGLLEQLLRLRTECAAHLLPDTHLFLEPELIFYPYLENECRFLYVPEEETVFEEQMAGLSDFMMKHVSYEPDQDDAVEIVYSLQTAVQRDDFDLRIWWKTMKGSESAARKAAGQKSAADRIWYSAEKLPGADSRTADGCLRDSAALDVSAPFLSSGDGLEIAPLADDWDLKRPDDAAQSSISKGRFPLLNKWRKGKRKQDKRKAEEIFSGREKGPEPAARERADLQSIPGTPLPEEPKIHLPAEAGDSMQTDGTVCLSESGVQPDDPVRSGKQHSLIPIDGGSEIPLDRPFLLIGTAARNVDIALRDRTVSRVHAEIFCDEAGVRIEDCNSSNGTMVNGEPLQPNEQRYLEPGMRIRMGRTEFLFR